MTTALITIAALLLQGTLASPASVEGRVIRSGTSEPVARASVLLTKVGGRLADSVVVITDSQGVFEVPNIPAGTYRVFAEHPDYAKAEFGQRSFNQPGSSITLEAGRKLSGITLALTPSGVISGRAVDQNGEPVRARIQALQRRYAQGEVRLTVVAEGQTNDLGGYRLFGVPPGSYLLSAAPYGFQLLQSGTAYRLEPPRIDSLISVADGFWSVARLMEDGLFVPPEILNGQSRPVQYYPGVAEPAVAQLVALQPGAVLDGMNFHFVPVPRPRTASVKVRGQVIDGATGQPVATAGVQIGTPPERPFAMDSLSRSVRIEPDAKGAFEIDSLDPGRYTILATSATGTSGLIPLTVGNSGVDGLRLVLGPRIATLNGRISGEGQSTTPDFTKMLVTLEATDFGRQIAPTADGTFSILNVMPGTYRVVLGGALANYYLKAARLGDTDVLNGELLLQAPPQQLLELVVSASTGTLDGVVNGADGGPAQAGRVVLVPATARRKYFEMYRTVTSDASGRFHIEGIVPGEYKVFAWEDIEENAWQVPEYLALYESQGKTVRVGENQKQSLELQLIPGREMGDREEIRASRPE